MSSKTKKRLFIALAGLLASSTAAVLVANSRTPAQVTGNAGCLASIEDACELSPLAWDGAPLALDFAADTALATYSALSDLVGATYGESAQWHYADEFGTAEDRQLISDINTQLGGAYNIGPQDQFQPDPSGANSVRHFNSLRMFAGGGGGISKSGSPGSGSGSSGGNSPGGSAPDSSSPGSGAPGDSSPGDSSPGDSSPGSSAPDSGAPGDGAPGGSSPGDNSPGSSAPGDGAPGGSTPGGDIPDDGVPGGGSPIGGPDKPVSVPEPGTTGLLAFSLALVAFMGRRRRAPV